MSTLRKLERYFYCAVTFLLAVYFAKASLDAESTLYSFIEAFVSIALFMYAVYFTEHTIRKIIELEYFVEE